MKMKKPQLTLLALSIAAAFAANVAYAGNIQSSSVAIAREAIVNDAQIVISPLVTYSFQGAVDATIQTQTFQVQLQLAANPTNAVGTTQPQNLPPIANAITKWASAGGVGSVVLKDAGPTGVGTFSAAFPTGFPATTTGLSPDGKTLFATFVVPAGTARASMPVIVFAPAPATAATLTGLSSPPTLVGQVVACDTASKILSTTFRHYTAVTSAATLADGVTNGVADEHTRNGANNNATLITFPTNIAVGVTATTGVIATAAINPVGGNIGFIAPAVGDAVTISTLTLDLGKVKLSNQASGYDTNLLNVYSLAAVIANPTTGAPASLGLTAGGVTGAGNVEALNETVTVTASNQFAAGSSVYLAASGGCSATVAGVAAATVATQTTTFNAANNIATIVLTGAGLSPAGAAAVAGLDVCYTVPGTTVVFPSTFTATATLTKEAVQPRVLNSVLNHEQDNLCSGPLFPLGGGVKVDVRNYATATTAGGWFSTIRVINPSETQSGRIYAQLIHADGSYGNWGELTTAAAPLAARGSMNLTSAQINALLVNAPVSNGAGYVAGVAAPVANVNTAGDRLRITADGITSLRVQNYLYNPASLNFIEASGDQGVDFDAITNRSPDISQTMTQDAQRGLAK